MRSTPSSVVSHSVLCSELERLGALGLSTPGVTYLPVDFASADLATALEAVGVNRDTITFFAWLGVTQYIPEPATDHALALVGRHAAGSEIVFDVIRPFSGLVVDELAISAAARALSDEGGLTSQICHENYDEGYNMTRFLLIHGDGHGGWHGVHHTSHAEQELEPTATRLCSALTRDKIRQTIESVLEHRLFVMVLSSNRPLISRGPISMYQGTSA